MEEPRRRGRRQRRTRVIIGFTTGVKQLSDNVDKAELQERPGGDLARSAQVARQRDLR